MNYKFGELIDTRLEYAPSALKIGNVLYSNPLDEQYLKCGYKYIVQQSLDAKEGFDIQFDKYTEDDTNIYVNYKYVELPKQKQEGFEISKLYLRIALTKLGIWDQVVEWMKSTKIMISEDQWINMYDAYCDALVIDTESELFGPYLAQAKETFSEFIAPEQIDEILLQCKAK